MQALKLALVMIIDVMLWSAAALSPAVVVCGCQAMNRMEIEIVDKPYKGSWRTKWSITITGTDIAFRFYTTQF